MHVLLNASMTRQQLKAVAKRWGRSTATEIASNPLKPRDCGPCGCHGLTWSMDDLKFMSPDGGYATVTTCPIGA